MKNLQLFEDDPDGLQLAADRREPVVWVRRLAVVDGPSATAELVREVVEFRRGLNIIRTEERQDDEDRPVGHSVGKTLLLRLIRYCLGEKAFATDAGRQAIAERIPSGYVAAEIAVNGEMWIVARPIGFDQSISGSKAMRGDGWRDIFAAWATAGKFNQFVDLLAEGVLRGTNVGALPHESAEQQWLDLLGWLARDQNCRYRHHNEWRDRESQSGTARLPLEKASLVIRAAMNLLDADEILLRTEHDRLLAVHHQLEHDMMRQSAFLELTQRELARLLNITKDIPARDLFAQEAIARAAKNRNSLKRLLGEEQLPEKLELFDRERIRCVAEESRARTELDQVVGNREVQLRRLQELNQQGTDSLWASFAQQARFCESFATEEEARANGCNYIPYQRTPGEPDPRIGRQIGELQEHITALNAEIEAKTGRLEELTEARTVAEKRWRDEEAAFRRKTGGIRQRIGKYDNLLRRARRIRNSIVAYNRLAGRIAKNESDREESLARQQQARERLESRRQELSRYFEFTLKRLIGPDATGSIQLDARGIQPKYAGSAAASGEAMATSATVLGFDLACLIAGMCGLGHLPRLLMHDSPREADMERPMYHRLFRLMFDLEAAFADTEPSFQYIVTTTTQPPAMPDGAPYVRLTLDARNERDLLLGKRF